MAHKEKTFRIQVGRWRFTFFPLQSWWQITFVRDTWTAGHIRIGPVMFTYIRLSKFGAAE
jgi:hypothetical protein